MPSYANTNVLTNTSGSTNPATGNRYIADLIGAARNGFLSCSLVRTTQSGSVTDLNTLPGATTQLQFQAFDIFAFNDSLQASRPLFLKVGYWTSRDTNSLQLVVEIGSAHNNSGSIISADRVLLGQTPYSSNGPGTPATSRIYASGDGSYIAMASLVDLTNSCQFFVCERLYDQYGNPTGNGFHILHTGITTTDPILVQQVSRWGEQPIPKEEYTFVNDKPGRIPAIYGGNLILGKVYPFIGRPLNPSPNVLVGESTTFPTTWSTVNYTMYGQQNRYINTGGTFPAQARGSTPNRLLMRY